MGASGAAGGELAALVTLKKEPDMRILYESAYGQMGDHREENLEGGTSYCSQTKISLQLN